MLGVIKKALQTEINTMKKDLNRLKIEKLMNKKEK